ncbi:MFS transporter [Streptomyces sp. NPDC059688]|uniref:MFS transporter n=1 Tax=Streptomyces sp. NPDC059688 TaxID=3346906 RepID=UPI0036CE013F
MTFRWVPSLPARTWIVFGGEIVSAMGSGATVPYLYVYLHVVCGMSVGLSVVMLNVQAMIWMGGAVLGGLAADRAGAKTVAVVGLAAAGAGTWALALADTAVGGALAVAGYSLAYAMLTPALDALVAEVVPAGQRQEVFGWRYGATNVGQAAGAGLAAVSLASAAEGLPVLYLLDGVSFMVFALLIATCVRLAPSTHPARRVREGYRAVATDPALRWICVMVVLVVAAGYAQLNVAVPAFVITEGLDARCLGWVLAANTLAVMLFQVPAARVTARHHRSRVLIGGVALMAGAWMLIQTAGRSGIPVLVVAVMLFGVGETLFAPVVSSLVNDLAPAALRGRYNAAQSLAWTGGFLVGTAAAGAALAAGGVHVLFAVLAGVMILAVPAVTRLVTRMPEIQKTGGNIECRS